MLSLAGAEKSAAQAPGCCSPVAPTPVFGLKETCGPPEFPGNPIVPLLCSQTPAEPWCLAFTALRCCPHQDDKEGLSDQITFGALSQSFSTRCLRFVPPLRATTQNSLPGVANLSGWEFNTH